MEKCCSCDEDMSPSRLPTKGKPPVTFITTIEDGGGPRSLRFKERSAETFLERLTKDYRYRAQINASLRRQRAIRRPQFALGPPIDRRDLGVEPSQSLPQMATGTPAAAPSVLPQARTQRITAPEQNQLSTNRSAEMDLGNILGAVNQAVDIYGRYRGYRDPGSAIMAQPVIGNVLAQGAARGLQALRGAAPMLGGLGTGAAGGMLGEFLGPETIPMADFGTDCVKPSDVVYMWDEKLGTYVPKKKRKRRRKQLITQSDIKGLAALKGVVGTGKIMETWIATHC